MNNQLLLLDKTDYSCVYTLTLFIVDTEARKGTLKVVANW